MGRFSLNYFHYLFMFAIVASGSRAAFGQPPAPQPMPGQPAAAAQTTAGVDVLTRGPLHEAFAEPANIGGAIPPVIAHQPPAPIDEAPAEYRPESASAVWIPGYWAWDDASNQFLWVSGVWRIPPAGRQWIAGYWTEGNGGYQRAPGFWASADSDDVQYYPQPPAPLEQGPTTEAPTADAFYAPGYWTWHDNQFVWTKGFWTAGRQGWVWTPMTYSWTPRGFVQVDPYWDYDLDHRGMIFAPAAISAAAYQRPGFVYTPSYAIDPAILSFYLFVRPACSEYYFGDYFDARFDQLGIYPWYAVDRVRGYAYDPLFTYDRWYYARRDPHWIENLEHWHSYYRDHPEARPPHDLAEERRFATERKDRPDYRMQMIGQPLSNLVHDPAFPMRLTPLTAAERSRAGEIARSNREFLTQRSRMESAAARTPGQRGTVGAAANIGPQKATWPRRANSIVGTRTLPGGEGAPPMRPSERGTGTGNAQHDPGARSGVVGPAVGANPPNVRREPERATPRETMKPVVPQGEPEAHPPIQPQTPRTPAVTPRPEAERPATHEAPRPQVHEEPRPQVHEEPRPQPQAAPRHPQAPAPGPAARPDAHPKKP